MQLYKCKWFDQLEQKLRLDDKTNIPVEVIIFVPDYKTKYWLDYTDFKDWLTNNDVDYELGRAAFERIREIISNRIINE